MKHVTINLYSLNELSELAQAKAITDHSIFLNELDAQGRDFDRDETIESIESNDYLFYIDGTIAYCTTYTGKHSKTGTTDFKLNGETYPVL